MFLSSKNHINGYKNVLGASLNNIVNYLCFFLLKTINNDINILDASLNIFILFYRERCSLL